MKHPNASRNVMSEEVRVIEVAGHLVFVVPREAIGQLGVRRDAKTVVVRYRTLSELVEKVVLERFGQAPKKWKHEITRTPSDELTRIASTLDASRTLSAIDALFRRSERALDRAINIAEDIQINRALESPTDIGAI